MELIDGIAIFGTHDAVTLEQIRDVSRNAARVALMADGHKGYIMPIGGVAAYTDRVSVVGVGFDIACGNCAIRTNLTLADMTDEAVCTVTDLEANPHRALTNPILNRLADSIQATISFGLGRTNHADDAPFEHPLFLDPRWYIIPNIGDYRDTLRAKARDQLGTVGSGNHYVDVFVDETAQIWVGVHFGSRGLGHTIATNFNAIAQGGTWGDRAKELEVLLETDSIVGQDYWALMELAGRYAYVGREWVARKVMALLGGQEVDVVHNHHNFAWKEIHYNPRTNLEEELVVVRKGATPAFPGQKGFVGGSMGDDAVILEGADALRSAETQSDTTIPTVNMTFDEKMLALQQASLCSTVHGAGRVMSRTEAAGKRNRKTHQVIKPGRISQEALQTWLSGRGVILRGGGLDEAPQAYRRLPDVLQAQGSTVEVLHTLRPVIVVMAGADIFDPFKD